MLRDTKVKRDEKLEPLANPGQVTGFVSPADDYAQDRLHIIEKLVKDPTNTFYFQMDSDEMTSYGIVKGAYLVVDRSLKIKKGNIVVVYLDEIWQVKELISINRKQFLRSDKLTIPVPEAGVQMFGVAKWSCNPL